MISQEKKLDYVLYLLLLTHDNSYDENGEQVNAYQKKVAKIMKIFISNKQILNMH